MERYLLIAYMAYLELKLLYMESHATTSVEPRALANADAAHT